VYARIVPPSSNFFYGPPAVTDAAGMFALMIPGDHDYVLRVELPNGQQAPHQELVVRPSQGDPRIAIVLRGGSK
jgi:hypothetical protein